MNPTQPLTNPERRQLKAAAQHLAPVVRVGKGGLTAAVLQSIERALTARELIKIHLDHAREERAFLAGQVAAATGARLIQQVGKMAVFYQPRPATAGSRDLPPPAKPC